MRLDRQLRRDGKEQDRARTYSRELWLANTWPKAIHPLSWLLQKFSPVPEWTEADIQALDKTEAVKTSTVNFTGIKNFKKSIIFYTDNQLSLKIAHAVQKRLQTMGLPIFSASLKPMAFGTNVHVKRERGYLTMFTQILVALEAATTDVVFFCEHDVLYHPSHFDFIPPTADTFYYNTNVWKLNTQTGHAVHYRCKQVSGIAVYRKLAIEHYRKRIALVEQNGFSMRMGFEPGTHGRPERVDDVKAKSWLSLYPNVDIRHGKNLSATKWSIADFRNKKFAEGWTESDTDIPGWGTIQVAFRDILVSK